MVPDENDEGDDADQRDGTPSTRGAGLAARHETVVNVLDAAKQRDVEDDARDRASVDRDRAADLEAFLTPDVSSGYGADLPARRHAAQDRHDATDDRASAADDRAVLSDAAQDREASTVISTPRVPGTMRPISSTCCRDAGLPAHRPARDHRDARPARHRHRGSRGALVHPHGRPPGCRTPPRRPSCRRPGGNQGREHSTRGDGAVLTVARRAGRPD